MQDVNQPVKTLQKQTKANTKQIDSAELARNKQKQQIYKITLENKLNQTQTTNWKQIEQAIIKNSYKNSWVQTKTPTAQSTQSRN